MPTFVLPEPRQENNFTALPSNSSCNFSDQISNLAPDFENSRARAITEMVKRRPSMQQFFSDAVNNQNENEIN